MTNLDLPAIKARYEAAPTEHRDYPRDARQLTIATNDILLLVAEVERLLAEDEEKKKILRGLLRTKRLFWVDDSAIEEIAKALESVLVTVIAKLVAEFTSSANRED